MRFLAAVVLAAGLIAADEPLSRVFEQAVKALNAGDYAAAEKGFEQVLAASPNQVGALQNLGLVFARTGRPDKAIELYRRALASKPNDKSLLLDLGLAYLRQESYGAALPVFLRLAEADPRNAAVSDPKLLYELTSGYLRQNQTTEARMNLEAFLSAVPPARAKFVLCRIYYDSGRFEEAERQCRQTLEIDARFAGAHRELGKVLVAQHRPAEAELNAAIQQDEQDAEAVYFLGVAFQQDGDLPNASRRFEQAIQLNPGFWGSYLYLGKLKLQLNQPAQAIPLLQKGAELNPEGSELFYELGRALMAAGQTEAAERAMQRVRELKSLELERDAKTLRKK